MEKKDVIVVYGRLINMMQYTIKTDTAKRGNLPFNQKKMFYTLHI